MPLMRMMQKVPAGMLLVPLLIGAVINTLAPDLKNAAGSFTGAFLTGLPAVLAAFYFLVGSSVEFRATPYILKKGGVLVFAKIFFATAIGAIAGVFLGTDPVQSGFFAGLSVLALVVALNDTNSAMFISLMNQYGRKRDGGLYVMMTFESGPFITMVTLGVAGLAGFPWPAVLGAVLPLLLGMLLGNLDRNLKDLFSKAIPALIPVLGLGVGFTIDLSKVLTAGLLGILLGLFVVLVGGAFLLGVDKITKGNGIAGLAGASTAGNAIAVPTVIAQANPAYELAAQQATILVACCVVVTSILCPVITAMWAKRVVANDPTLAWVDGAVEEVEPDEEIDLVEPSVRDDVSETLKPLTPLDGDQMPLSDKGSR
ncbi:2-keto-3-deoxygluconate permease [Rhodococcoides kyotonense]|uniref:2-keto-3-deoxygluconate permease n=1 Tax=Rhodococcoides kyotonense TaxID=398843 RepID=A0A239NFS8_9NOCA|nr:2-keto-3-deoxygluconate permease [Rhodococcus kyotonensis]SNT53343.1 2-keto-3-deoxygluconate permease [Rhodococcus kyotonensis]